MKYEISEDKKRLTILADEDDKREIAEMIEDNGLSALVEYDALGGIIANSDLDWISPEENGDLTDALILGYRDEEGFSTGERWAYMDYQVRSFLSDLINIGKATFIAP